jgi:hypothetical protein
MSGVQPIFVLGSPRSGTTLIGNYIGNSKSIFNLGEYFGFAFTYYKSPRWFTKVPSNVKDKYLTSLREHACKFASSVTLESGLEKYCDSTPWNILIIKELVEQFPKALFILTLRHYAGVIQSLERSYNDGFSWAGKDLKTRAQLYAECYLNIADLPLNNTVCFSYDELCSNPTNTIKNFKNELHEKGFCISELNDEDFIESHATTPSHKRPVIAEFDENLGLKLNSIPPFDISAWTSGNETEILPIIKEAIQVIEDFFPEKSKFLKPIYSRGE